MKKERKQYESLPKLKKKCGLTSERIPKRTDSFFSNEFP